MLVHPLQPNGLLKRLFSGYYRGINHAWLSSAMHGDVFPAGLRDGEVVDVGYTVGPWGEEPQDTL